MYLLHFIFFTILDIISYIFFSWNVAMTSDSKNNVIINKQLDKVAILAFYAIKDIQKLVQKHSMFYSLLISLKNCTRNTR